jgi:serine/threonine protein kinase
LKPDNILLDENHRPRICDFGSSRDQSLRTTLTGMVGTPLYMAPELYEIGNYDGKVDVFSFALILYEILTGCPVFSPRLSLPQLALKVAKGERADIPRTAMPFVQDLIRKGWSSDPVERPSFTDIFENLREHEFCVVQEGFDRNEVALYIEWIGGSPTA